MLSLCCIKAVNSNWKPQKPRISHANCANNLGQLQEWPGQGQNREVGVEEQATTMQTSRKLHTGRRELRISRLRLHHCHCLLPRRAASSCRTPHAHTTMRKTKNVEAPQRERQREKKKEGRARETEPERAGKCLDCRCKILLEHTCASTAISRQFRFWRQRQCCCCCRRRRRRCCWRRRCCGRGCSSCSCCWRRSRRSSSSSY